MPHHLHEFSSLRYVSFSSKKKIYGWAASVLFIYTKSDRYKLPISSIMRKAFSRLQSYIYIAFLVVYISQSVYNAWELHVVSFFSSLFSTLSSDSSYILLDKKKKKTLYTSTCYIRIHFINNLIIFLILSKAMNHNIKNVA